VKEMYKEFLLQTKTETTWYNSEEELMQAKNKVEPWDIVFCGKVKVEMVYNADQNKLLYV
jgi:hypothetical protein